METAQSTVPLEQWIAGHLDNPGECILIIVRDDLKFYIGRPGDEKDQFQGFSVSHTMTEGEYPFAGIHCLHTRIYANDDKLPDWARSQLRGLATSYRSEILPLNTE